MGDTATQAAEGSDLERKLQELQEVERFEPPEEFKRQALWNDPSVYDEASKDPEAWWAKQAEELHWFEKWDQVLDWSAPPFAKWFVGGKLNVAYNCTDRHVEAGNGERVAIHWEGEPGYTRTITYADLQREVSKAANAFAELGVGKGDRVAIQLPMIPEAVI